VLEVKASFTVLFDFRRNSLFWYKKECDMAQAHDIARLFFFVIFYEDSVEKKTGFHRRKRAPCYLRISSRDNY
jgi:hypothetical protein